MAKAVLRAAALGWLACVSAQAAEAPPGGDAAPPAVVSRTLTPAEARANAASVVAPPSPPSNSPDFSQDIGMTETYYIPACRMGLPGGAYRASWREISDFHDKNGVAWLSELDRHGAPDWYARPGSRAPEPDNRPDAVYPAAAGGKVGEVVVKVVIDAKGRTRDAMVICSNDTVFDAPALAFARKVVFKPALRDGRAVADYGNVSMRFYPDGPQYGFRRHK
ncbi:TonB family protein [Lysobacter enzymogenes]|uniref:TonB family protein n=1 Tax=Lysobacter enzymogenes TaxID=69 RepID=UPI00099B6845|nr:TonB family protein [Lysobacter enzymogenes]UZW61697.1 energy transducer TonB [Lysobacter enzymogenes]